MKSSLQLTPEELSELIASVLSTNGHNAISQLGLYKDGQPVDFDEARIEVSTQLLVRCAPEQSKYDKMLERYLRSVEQFQPQPQAEPENETE